MADRIILHSDLNNFYASVECMINPKIKNNAVIVVGNAEKRHGIVLAKNYIAKQYGIRTGDTIMEAENKCNKEVKLTKITARLELYRKVSRKVQEIYRKYTDNMEMFGIDEAWLDITKTAKDYTEAMDIAEMIRCEVKAKIGITVSIGVSFNKVFAKLGSDLKKPDAITLITKGNFRDRIWVLNVNTLLYVGRSTSRSFEKMNIKTIGDLANTNPELLTKYLGVVGKRLWEYANGLDCEEVKRVDEYDDIKSIGNSITWHEDLVTIDDVKSVLYLLAEQVAYRLKKENMYCKEISIYVKDNTLHSDEHQCKLSYPTNTSKDIADNAIMLFNKHFDLSIPIRALGIRLKDFSDQLQVSMLNPSISKQEKLDNLVTTIRKKYGSTSITRGRCVGKSLD